KPTTIKSEYAGSLPAIKTTHEAGSLNMTQPHKQERVEVDISTNKEDGKDYASNHTNGRNDDTKKQAPTDETQAGQALWFDDNKSEHSKQDEGDDDSILDTPKPQILDSSITNNMNDMSKESGYKTPDSQQKPTVFDTNEYHVELHDWSKLEYKSNTLWYLLGLLFAIFAAGIFFIVSGFSVPFIG
ncbi:MAG: hypothetical protein QG593_302, partial [Patescibacteria group bacterium]|nr:hypothetical protein [Patescibacteria group bacterium]